MPSLLLVSYTGVLGGAEQVLLDCAAALPGPHLLACPEGPLADRARLGGHAVVVLPTRQLDLRAGRWDRLRATADLLAHAREVRSLTRDLAPDLTVAWGMRSALATLALPGDAVRAVAHQDFLPGSAIGRGVRAAVARAAAVIVPSHAIAADLDPEGRWADRLHVVAPGVDTSRFAGLGTAPEEPRVLVLGALASWKRPDLALEICALARRRVPGLRVRLVGAPLTSGDDPTLSLTTRAAAPDLAGAVEFVGPRPDPRQELGAASCLLHCAPREPFGLVLLEAAAAGRPVVAPAAAGPAEIVTPETGALYAPGDAIAGAHALVAVLSDRPRAIALGDAGRERVRERFDRSRTRAGFRSVLEPLIDAKPKGVPPASPALALVTVTHNSAEVLGGLLDSVSRHLPLVQMICVDSGSTDASVAMAASRSWVQSVDLGANVGFGTACNRGLELVTAPVTVLINPDVQLVDDSLLALAAEALRHDRPDRILAPVLLGEDGRRQDNAHPGPGSAAAFVHALVPPALVPGRAGLALAPWRAHAARRVGWATGAVLGACTKTLRRLGPFDEHIFMYGEDLELGMRAADAGIATWFWPGARVIHKGAHSTSTAFGGEDFERLARARHDAVVRSRGPGEARRDDIVQAVTFVSRIAAKRSLGRTASREIHQLRALGAVRSAQPDY